MPGALGTMGRFTLGSQDPFFAALSGCLRRTWRLPLAIFSVCRARHLRRAFRVRFARVRFRDASAILDRPYKVRQWLARPRVAPRSGSRAPCSSVAASRDHATTARISGSASSSGCKKTFAVIPLALTQEGSRHAAGSVFSFGFCKLRRVPGCFVPFPETYARFSVRSMPTFSAGLGRRGNSGERMHGVNERHVHDS